MAKVTLAQYYRGFWSLFGAFATIPFVFPLIHIVVRIVAPDSSKSAYLYPPLGDFQNLSLAATFLFLIMVTFGAFVYCEPARQVRRSKIVAMMLGFLVGIVALIGMYGRFVRKIDIPSINQEVIVSVGYQRTRFALKTYPNWSDWDMLHDQGPSEETIQRLWTPSSVSVVRVGLWLMYTVTLGCLLVVICVGVYKHASDSSEAGIEGSRRGPMNPPSD